MATHKFKVGESVRFPAPATSRGVAGIYKVIALLPEERGDNQYRLGNPNRLQHRVARESQLSPTALR
jgi:hypothetical protein